VNVSSDNGEGWYFGFFLDPDDPDDGGWFPSDCVRFFEEDGMHDEPVDRRFGDNGVPSNDGAAPSEEPSFDDASCGAANIDTSWASAPQAEVDTGDDSWGAAPTADPVTTEAAWGASTFPSAPEIISGSGCGQIDGLVEWLVGLSLQKYEAQAAQWCADMGAVCLVEVEENWEDFAEAMSLKPLERKRLAKKMMA